MTENQWVSSTGEVAEVNETGLYIEGEFLPDTPQTTTEGTTNV